MAGLSTVAHGDKVMAFKTFRYANAIDGRATLLIKTGDFDVSTPGLRGSLLAWEQWKADVYALAKATLSTPHAFAACETLTLVIVRRLQRGRAVRIDGDEVAAAL
jgi:hypothetical protein